MKPGALKNYNFNRHQLCIKIKKVLGGCSAFSSLIFEEFVPCVKKFLRKSVLPEKALLLVSNTPSYSAITLLQCEGIIVKFLLSIMFSIVQPVDPGVIVSFKQNYHKNLLQKILLNCHKKYANLTNCLKNITRKDIFWLADTWNAV